MSKLGQAIVLFLLITLAAPLPVARGDHNLTNGDNKYWVARREKDDANRYGDVAYIVKIEHDSSGTKLQAKLWAYDNVDVPGGKYIIRNGYPIVLSEVDSSPKVQHSLSVEWCKFKTTIESTKHVLRVSLHKRAVKKNGNWKLKKRKFDRVLMQYTKELVVPLAPKAPAAASSDCPEVPVDDVLEEEPLPEDPTEEPPEYPDP